MDYTSEIKPAIDPQQALAILLETASEQFKIGQRIITNDIEIKFDDKKNIDETLLYYRSKFTIINALFKEFLFNCVRARRICEKGSGVLGILDEDLDKFVKSLSDLTPVRNVNEHGFDLKDNRTKPKIYTHSQNLYSLDDTSLIILGPEEIYMGPVNIFQKFKIIEQMISVSGFLSLSYRNSDDKIF